MSAKIALIGDVGLFGKYTTSSAVDVFDYLSSAKKYLAGFDYVIANLEVPFIEKAKRVGQKSAYLKSDKANVSILKYLGVDAVCLANNHSFDYGRAGYEETVGILEQESIEHFGVDGKDHLLELGGEKIAVHGYCSYTSNPLGMPTIFNSRGINKLVVPRIKEKMKAYSSQGYFNIVSYHTGDEHINYPRYSDVILSRVLADVANYVYYGHHPHVIQGVETYQGSLIAHSLGNFLFDDVYTERSSTPLVTQSKNNKTGLILGVEVRDGKIEGHECQITYSDNESLRLLSGMGRLNEYSNMLSWARDEYEEYRGSCLSDFLSERKSRRDFNWYVKRLNLNSAGIIARARYNSMMHKRTVLDYIV